MYFPEIRKHALIFQAVIGGLTTEYFHQYFLALFSLYEIDFSSADNFMGMPKRIDFYQLYTPYWYDEWATVLKGLIHALDAVSAKDKFLELASNLRTIPTITDFDNVCNSILNEFPNARRWLRWWLQPDVRSMIFVSGLIMKSNLRFHICRTSNSVESFHNIFYTLIKGGRPLRKTLRQALKIAKSDQDDLSQFYEYGMLTTYNRQPRLRKSRKIGTNHYAQNDSRAPDNTDAIFGDEKQLKKQELEKQKATIQTPPTSVINVLL
ncbi:hypothetical protein BDC45DRAFT_492827 [Circinella umbellata]|nr:hypothetical protein BDC45DRAFT_492827 [Circinella umbellata]